MCRAATRCAETDTARMLGNVLAAIFAALACVVTSVSAAPAQDKTITVFAAASLKNALDDVNAAFLASSRVKPTTSYAASSALVKQIEQGAPADVFISADLDWMNYASQKGLVQDATRVKLLGNKLVLIAPKESKLDMVAIAKGFDLAKLAGDGRISVADVRAVPAGKYAKAALEHFGGWAAAEPKLAMAENVRAALALVGRGEAPLGIVYETDATIDTNVKIVGHFPEGSHQPIVYPAALVKNAKQDATAYLAFLQSDVAKGIYAKYGFTFLEGERKEGGG
jgi:molybdate transport system substrate-binding protein